MVYDYKRIPNRIDRRLTGLAGPDYDATGIMHLTQINEGGGAARWEVASVSGNFLKNSMPSGHWLSSWHPLPWEV